MSQFQASENSLTERMARGHVTRTGHTLKGVWVYTMPGYRQLQRTCCNTTENRSRTS